MIFNSLPFFLFALVFFPSWAMVRRFAPRQVAWAFLAIASLFFYGWWDWRFVFLLLALGTVDFFAGKMIDRYPARKHLFLGLSLTTNLSTLFFFKYLNFAFESIAAIADRLGLELTIPTHYNIVLPIGLSFITFQSLSYTIDVYRGVLKPARNWFHFLAFMALFPQLVAGPIVRATHLLPQIEALPASTADQRWRGMKQIAYGLFKKMVVADTIAQIVDLHYNSAEPSRSPVLWWIVAITFAVQIYCDFSGYSDIAIGLARWMGFEFPDNFRHPFIADSFRDFWNRWHISLSSWLRDYVFYPLGKLRGTKAWILMATVVTFLISGVWHGGAWHFVVWGGIYGGLLALETLTKWDKRLRRRRGGRAIATLVVFLTTVIALVVFRSSSLAQAGTILGTMIQPHGWLDPDWWPALGLLDVTHYIWLPLVIGVLMLEVTHYTGFATGPFIKRISMSPLARLAPLGIALLLLGAIYLRGPAAAFIYFQF